MDAPLIACIISGILLIACLVLFVIGYANGIDGLFEFGLISSVVIFIVFLLFCKAEQITQYEQDHPVTAESVLVTIVDKQIGEERYFTGKVYRYRPIYVFLFDDNSSIQVSPGVYLAYDIGDLFETVHYIQDGEVVAIDWEHKE